MFVLLKCPTEVIGKNVITPPELFNTKALSTVATFYHQGRIQDLRQQSRRCGAKGGEVWGGGVPLPTGGVVCGPIIFFQLFTSK